jgi:hypothetical protein
LDPAKPEIVIRPSFFNRDVCRSPPKAQPILYGSGVVAHPIFAFATPKLYRTDQARKSSSLPRFFKGRTERTRRRRNRGVLRKQRPYLRPSIGIALGPPADRRAARAAACTAGFSPTEAARAAHTYSQNWSRITSISVGRVARNGHHPGVLPNRRGISSRMTVSRFRQAIRIAPLGHRL